LEYLFIWNWKTRIRWRLRWTRFAKHVRKATMSWLSIPLVVWLLTSRWWKRSLRSRVLFSRMKPCSWSILWLGRMLSTRRKNSTSVSILTVLSWRSSTVILAVVPLFLSERWSTNRSSSSERAKRWMLWISSTLNVWQTVSLVWVISFLWWNVRRSSMMKKRPNACRRKLPRISSTSTTLFLRSSRSRRWVIWKSWPLWFRA